MELFFLFSMLITIAAGFSYLNVRTFQLPAGISLMLMGTLFSVLLIFAGGLSPDFTLFVKHELSTINFSEFLLGILLSFLLFAGSLHVHLGDLKDNAAAILSFATVGTLVSTVVMAFFLHYLLPLFGIELPVIYCLLFGALISPTDPIAVMGILKKANLSKSVEVKITGESLFNDGIGVVIFATLLEVAAVGVENVSAPSVGALFVQEAVGGIVAGLVIGFIGYQMMKRIDHFQTEILISLAMVMGGYSLCHAVHVSGPLAMVVAGLMTGNIGKKKAMSDVTRDYLEKFWEVTDEVLNAILFLLMGLEIVIVNFQLKYLSAGVLAALALVVTRYISLWIPVFTFGLSKHLQANELKIMTWGGLRGGISIALALSLPANEYKNIIVAITFIIVIISIIFQGLTIGPLIKRLTQKPSAHD